MIIPITVPRKPRRGPTFVRVARTTRPFSSLEGLVDALSGQEFVYISKNLTGRVGLRHKVEELPDDHQDAQDQTSSQRPPHESHTIPVCRDLLLPRQLRYFHPRNLE
jgi:hypothetical protein